MVPFKKHVKTYMARQKKLTTWSKNFCQNCQTAVLNWGRWTLTTAQLKNMCSDMAALTEAVEEHEVEILHFRPLVFWKRFVLCFDEVQQK